MGDTSLLDAYLVGATIEDLDIYDLMTLSDSTDNVDILYVYDNLTRGSRNHIRSFYGKIIASGGEYSAQYISQTLLDSIISTPKGTCNKSFGFHYYHQGNARCNTRHITPVL